MSYPKIKFLSQITDYQKGNDNYLFYFQLWLLIRICALYPSNFLELHSKCRRSEHVRTHTHPCEHMYTNLTSMRSSEGLSTDRSRDSRSHHTHTHPCEHMYTNLTSMRTSEGLSTDRSRDSRSHHTHTLTPVNICTQILPLWGPPKDWAPTDLEIPEVTTSVSSSTGTSLTT
jgi:hypothetical protein